MTPELQAAVRRAVADNPGREDDIAALFGLRVRDVLRVVPVAAPSVRVEYRRSPMALVNRGSHVTGAGVA